MPIERRDEDGVCVSFQRCFNVLFLCHHHAQVDDLEAGLLERKGDDLIADSMRVRTDHSCYDSFLFHYYLIEDGAKEKTLP